MDNTKVIFDIISEKVKTGEWKKGSRIFSEMTWAKELGIARNAVREALNVLINEKAIEKKVGSGAYITDVSYFKNRKYIIISVDSFYLTSETGYSYRVVLNNLQKIIENNNYESLVYIFNEEEANKPILKVDFTEVAGVITFFGNNKVDDRFLKANIPIVSIMGTNVGLYPATLTNYLELYLNIKQIIEEYKWKDVLLFTYEKKIFNSYDNNVIVHLASEYEFEKKFNLVRIPFETDVRFVSNAFRETMNSLKKVPDALIFLDDTIYKACQGAFAEFDSIMFNTNIITVSNGDIDIRGKYSPTVIGYDLNLLCQKSFEMLNRYINNSYLGEIREYMQPKIMNKKVLK